MPAQRRRCCLLLAYVAIALGLRAPTSGGVALGSWTRTRAVAATVSSPPAAKVALLAALPCEAVPLPQELLTHVEALIDTTTTTGVEAIQGRFCILACEPLGAALEAICPRKSWHRSWLTRTTQVSASGVGPFWFELELDVLMAATGLRVGGEIVQASSEEIVVSLTEAEFFEPSDEFGIAKSIAKCEEVIRPQLSSSVQLSLSPIYADDDLYILRDRAGSGGLTILSRLPDREDALPTDGSDTWESFIDRGGYKVV